MHLTLTDHTPLPPWCGRLDFHDGSGGAHDGVRWSLEGPSSPLMRPPAVTLWERLMHMAERCTMGGAVCDRRMVCWRAQRATQGVSCARRRWRSTWVWTGRAGVRERRQRRARLLQVLLWFSWSGAIGAHDMFGKMLEPEKAEVSSPIQRRSGCTRISLATKTRTNRYRLIYTKATKQVTVTLVKLSQS